MDRHDSIGRNRNCWSRSHERRPGNYRRFVAETPTGNPRTLCTERLILRPWQDTDLDAVWGYRQLPQVQEWLGWRPADRAEFAAGQVERHRERGHQTLVVELAGRIIGDVVVMPRDGWAQSDVTSRAVGVEAELGWTFDPDHGGQGYATEAIRAVVDHCFQVLGVRRVQAGCFAANVASWRLMERIGMRREEHSRKSGLHHSGGWLDGMLYGILAEEWPAEQ